VKDKDDEARKVIKILRGNNKEKLDNEILEIKQVHITNSGDNSFFTHIRDKSTKKAFYIVLIQFFFFQFTGSNAILFYTTTIFKEANLNLDPGIASIIVVSSQIIGTSISSVLVDRIGRRFMLMTSAVLMALSHALLGIYFVIKNADLISDDFSFIPIASLCLYEVAFGSGIGPVSYVRS
jgi:MFS family permease